MARDWHELFKSWAKPPSQTEETKGSNAARMIKEAARESGVLAGHSFAAYATGSDRNNTNIRLGSDVDIALVLQGPIFYSLPSGRRAEEFGLGGVAEYGLTDFRRDLGAALKWKFGGDVTRGNKTFDIKGNSYRIPADATPFLVHRAYSGRRNPDGSWHYVEGVETRPVNAPSTRIVNSEMHRYSPELVDASVERIVADADYLKRARSGLHAHRKLKKRRQQGG